VANKDFFTFPIFPLQRLSAPQHFFQALGVPLGMVSDSHALPPCFPLTRAFHFSDRPPVDYLKAVALTYFCVLRFAPALTGNLSSRM